MVPHAGEAAIEEKFAPTSRVDDVYRRLRDAIIDGDFLPGAPLRYQELTEVFGMSLIPIREAIRKLEVERLVESEPNKGTRVASISAEDVEDVYTTRIAIEQEALRKAIPHIGDKELSQLRALRQEMFELARRNDPFSYELHRQVHFSIYERSRSPWLLHMIEILWSHTERHRRLVAKARPFVDERVDHHGRIIDAIEAGDSDNAVAALRQDLERTSHLVVEAYIDGG